MAGILKAGIVGSLLATLAVTLGARHPDRGFGGGVS